MGSMSISAGERKKQALGKLCAIGVGPGDSELLTIKAVRRLKDMKTVFAAISNKQQDSLSVQIARPYLNPGAELIPLHFPMVRDKQLLENVWTENARKVLDVLRRPADAAFITLGDPSTYSTFTYLIRHIEYLEPGIEAEIIPGITSYQAAAARTGVPLAQGEESLAIVSGARGGQELKQMLGVADNLVVLKVYRYFREILEVIREEDLLDKSVAVRKCSLPGESISRDIETWEGDRPSYFTLLLVKKQDKGKKVV
jgi:precorrin-2/cobalt-factor-2 C20-methyltransferase